MRHIACVGTDCATKPRARAVGGVEQHCSPAIKMNLLSTQHCNVLLPLQVVLPFCLCFCSLTPQLIWGGSSAHWCVRGCGDLKVPLMSLCKGGMGAGFPECLLTLFSCISSDVGNSQISIYAATLFPMDVEGILILGVWQEAGCAAGGMRCRLQKGSYAGMVRHQPSTPDLT